MIRVSGNFSDSSLLVFKAQNFLAGILLLILLTVVSIGAQDTVTGGFQGDVSDNRTGNPIAGAVVTIRSDQTGATYNLTTDSKGVFFQGLLAPGSYQIRIAVPGFRERLLRRVIRITATGDIVPVPVSMEPETTPSASPVVPEEPDNIRVVINTIDARRSSSTKKEEIAQIPIGGNGITRSFDEIALLVPGVAPPPQTIGDVAGPGVGPGVGSAGQFSVNGLRSRGNNFTVDGSDNNDEDIGVRRQGFISFIPQPIESIEEFSIITLLAPAQFGRNIGAQVNAVSKAGGNKFNGSLYGHFNSSRLNARNQFDSTNGDATSPLRTAASQSVLLDGQPINVRNQSGGEDSFTFAEGGGTVGGAILPNRLFYFFSGEYQRINAQREKNFAVPTVEQRGPFRSGATGIASNFFTGTQFQTPLFPTGPNSNAVFSLFPFVNDPTGIYGANTFTQTLRADGRGVILSGRLDDNFKIGDRAQSITGRYNFTDDDKTIPAVNEAIFSTVRSKIQTHNLSLFLNSDLSEASSSSRLFNQVRFSVGQTHLKFDEVRNTDFLTPSDDLPNTPFMLNTRAIFNVTLPQYNGQARYTRIQPGFGVVPESVENVIGPLGQVVIAGFSPLGVDVYNFPQDRINRTYQIADELSWRIGRHAFVFGADIRRTDLNSDLPRLARTLLTFNGAPRLIARNGTCSNGGIGDFCFLPQSDPRSIIRPEDLVGFGAASNSILTLNVDRPDSRVKLQYDQLNFYAQDTWRVNSALSLSFGLRYEYNTPVHEVDGLIEKTFSDPRLTLVPVLRDLINNRSTLYAPDRNNFGPRVGVAYSANLLGDKRISVFRAGYGLFYDQILGAVANQSRNVFPTYLTFNYAASIFSGFGLSIDNPAMSTINGVPLRRPGTVNAYNIAGFNAAGTSFADVLSLSGNFFANSINVTLPSEKMEMPMAHHYSFIFEQQLSKNYSFSVGYVGTTGRNLLRFTTPNLGSSLTVSPTSLESSPFAAVPIARGSLFIPSRPLDRVNAGGYESLGAVNQFETTAPSNYHSLQSQLQARFLNRLNFQLSYTFSKATDEVSDVFDLAGAYVLPQNSFDLKAESGPANFDVRHRIAYDLVYSFPAVDGNRFIRHLTRDLQIATTGRFHSGQPFTVNSVIDVNLDGNVTDRLNTLQGIAITGDRSQPLRLTTANTASLLAPFGQNGQIGRNTFRAGNVLELDVSVIKQFKFDTTRLTFRTDIFNIIDRANYGIPIRLLEAPGFGRAVNTVTPGSRVQFSVKFEF
ncbi:MAG TPA: carboxypeptidase-like regulatory domain-containing protein [Pyrinomonadaceae bacterium]|nr:carboxypeptidase-like regulatory domain-containing protein [Pyrinomonadaceae bacterium]